MPADKNITSFSNPRIKNILRLRAKKTDGPDTAIIVEGVREVLRAKESGIIFQEIYFCPDFCRDPSIKGVIEEVQGKNPDVQVFEAAKEISKKISFGQREEGILVLCQRPQKNFNDFKFKKAPFMVVVERVEKPGNLGALLRSCDGAGVDGVIVCDNQTDVYNPNVVRASVGTIFSTCVVESSKEEALSFLKENHIDIFSATPGAKKFYTQADFTKAVACVVGSEEAGLSDFWLKNSNEQIKIPMQGKADSLNVSATAAILLYEVLRQRNALN